ncbi:hypothetical protein [Saccharolobus shibatae]|uniref:Uncharacterized protein n=1 Tax=Saccharolobus shibatae TaxID=2286 RepID=A0A8F5BVN2_9CREN|nr:hypothetical protein [Saccharolobus shibatae]QXJ32215.1 hypothetical protein J5U21_01866 [Saccharolobus shibatae]QXJ35239.1 hypothetical protein J5U22_01786 [Saccharolobus shibatae]
MVDEIPSRKKESNNEVSDEDISDLLYVLRMKFGEVPQSVIDRIKSIKRLSTIDRLILVAANVSTFNDFLIELNAGEEKFKMVGDKFNPLRGGSKW